VNNRRWNLMVLVIVGFVALVTAATNYRINFYGLFGDVTGKRLFVYDNERTTKYLFSYNYIPRNFDGLLIGSSASANWNTSDLSGIRMYNASINGANISEEVLIANQVLQRSRPRLVLLLIHPYLTESYGRKSGFMNPQEYWGSLGSIQLFRGYWSRWAVEHGSLRREFNEFGADDFVVPPGAAAVMPGIKPASFFVDERALQQYRELLERSRVGGARVAGVIPPTGMQLWNSSRSAYLDYGVKIKALFQPGEPIIDLNTPELDEFRSNPANFQDGVHLASRATAQVVQIINARLKQAGIL